jgi:hypothetical protein
MLKQQSHNSCFGIPTGSPYSSSKWGPLILSPKVTPLLKSEGKLKVPNLGAKATLNPHLKKSPEWS